MNIGQRDRDGKEDQGLSERSEHGMTGLSNTPMSPMDRVRSKRRYNKVHIGSVIILAAATAGGILVYTGVSRHLTVGKDGIKLVAAETREMSPMLRGFGKLVPSNDKLMIAPVLATVQELDAPAGTVFKKGETLLRLSTLIASQKVEAAKAAEHKAQYALREAEEMAKLDNATNAQATIALTSQLALDKKELSAKRAYLVDGIVAKLDVEKLALRVELGEAQLQAQRVKTEAGRSTTASHIDMLKNDLDVSRKNVEYASNVLAATDVTAPFNGSVEEVFVSVGQSLAEGERIMRIVAAEKLQAQISVTQNDASRITVQDEVELNVQGRTVKGRVQRIEPAVKDGQVVVTVLPIEDLPPSVRVNQSVTAALKPTTPKIGTYLRQDAELPPYEVISAFLLSEGRKCIKTQIQLGASMGDYVEVVKGLKAGQSLCLGIPEPQKSHSAIDIDF